MARSRPILIACPQYRKLVRGSYQADDSGAYRVGPDGGFLLRHARCGQDGGRCMQTLCVLHRYNRGGGDSWYPARLLAGPEPPRRRSGRGRGASAPARARRRTDAGIEILR